MSSAPQSYITYVFLTMPVFQDHSNSGYMNRKYTILSYLYPNKKGLKHCMLKPLILLEPLSGIEPLTYGLRIRCSTT